MAGTASLMAGTCSLLASMDHYCTAGGNDLKKALKLGDKVVLVQAKTILDYTSRKNLQGEKRATYVLLKYDPTYSFFTVVGHVPIPIGEQQPTTIIFENYFNLRDIGVIRPSSSESSEANTEQEAENRGPDLVIKEVGTGEVDAEGRVNKREDRRGVGRHTHTHAHLLHNCPHSEASKPTHMASQRLKHKAKRCYRPKKEVAGQTDSRPAIWSADWPLVLRKHGRCQQLMAGDARGRPMECGDGQQAIPYPSKQKHKYLV
ncbi:hypothetical protein CsSME_00001695 [Camellia sinensis var. sinensis]